MTSLLDRFSKKNNPTQAKTDGAIKPAAVKSSAPTEQKPAVKIARPVKKSTEDFSHRLLIRPLVSEKGAYLQAANKYLFEVARTANKITVQNAIEQLYDVKVIKVNILNQDGKKVRVGRIRGKRKAWKKAVITLQPGQRITTVEGV